MFFHKTKKMALLITFYGQYLIKKFYSNTNVQQKIFTAEINHLPPEILWMIFQELNLKDIGNCSQTCIMWKELIKEMFKNKGTLGMQLGR